MDESKLIGMLRDVFLEEAAASPSSYPSQTPDCLLFMRLPPRDHAPRWSVEEEAHLEEGCGYCQRTIAASYRVECPKVSSLVGYALHPSTELFCDAIEFHVETDRCVWCRSIVHTAQMAKMPLEWVGTCLSLGASASNGFAIAGALQFQHKSAPTKILHDEIRPRKVSPGHSRKKDPELRMSLTNMSGEVALYVDTPNQADESAILTAVIRYKRPRAIPTPGPPLRENVAATALAELGNRALPDIKQALDGIDVERAKVAAEALAIMWVSGNREAGLMYLLHDALGHELAEVRQSAGLPLFAAQTGVSLEDPNLVEVRIPLPRLSWNGELCHVKYVLGSTRELGQRFGEECRIFVELKRGTFV